MNKTKMILAGIGGAIGLVVLVLVFFVVQAFSAKTAAIEGDDEEGTDGLETVESRVQSLGRKPIYPCAASVTAIEKNQESVDEWCKDGLSLAARGDRIFPKTTPAQFKTDLVRDARRLMALPGGVSGKLVKPDFAFGPFKDYIVEGKMPSEAELAELQRKWDDVTMITEMLATNGVAELVDIGFANVNRDESKGMRDEKKKGKGNGGRAKMSADASSLIPHPSSHSYLFTFAARPTAFIQALNALEQCERFITVDGFSFVRPGDVIAEALGGGDEAHASKPAGTGGRRGRRGRREEAVRAADSDASGKDSASPLGKNGVVTDPLLDAPMTVTMTVSVHDFRSLEENGEGASK